MADEDERGDACYFYRDLKRGSYGGDVSCLQQFLRAEGLLFDEPSGYFGTATEDALVKWQSDHSLVPAKGILGFSSRVAYSRQQRLPTTEQLRDMEKEAEASGRAEVIEFCCELVGSQEVTRSKRCKEDASLDDRMHLCSEACQMAVSEACDKAFPTSQNSEYRKCLSLIPRNCRDACRNIVKAPKK